MELLTSAFSDFIFPFILLLGLLIFVHELGHFLVAKFFGVRVETFSLGFGKKVLKRQWGDTTYCISMIPLGGYVKMFGDDPTVEVPDKEKKFSFLDKPVSQRIAIVLAGPLMNFFFAILVFTMVAISGEQVASPHLGDIPEEAAAYQAGFRSGDEILSVNGKEFETWKDLKDFVAAHPEQVLNFRVQRTQGAQDNKEVVNIEAKTEEVPNPNLFSTDERIGHIEGFTNESRASVVGISDPTSLAHIAGFQTGDYITAINDRPVDRWRDLVRLIKEEVSKDKLKFDIVRFETPTAARQASEKERQDLTLTLEPPADLSGRLPGEEVLAKLGLEHSGLFLQTVMKDRPAGKAGLRPGDKIVQINGQKMEKWEEVVETIGSYRPSEGPLSITVHRGGIDRTFELQPEKTSHMSPQGAEVERYTIGIMSQTMHSVPDNYILTHRQPFAAVTRGMELTVHWTQFTVLTYLRLIQNKVSAKNIGGVISIGQVASRSYQVGLSAFLTIMAIVSINLFILNLLPIPILDGGHLVFFTIEALRGAPLSMRKIEIAQQIGLVLLLGLMALGFYNDISRLIGGNW